MGNGLFAEWSKEYEQERRLQPVAGVSYKIKGQNYSVVTCIVAIKFSKFIAEEVFSFWSATFANDSMCGCYKWQVTSFFIFKGFLLIS